MKISTGIIVITLITLLPFSFISCSKCLLPEGSVITFNAEESKWIPEMEHIRDSIYFRCGGNVKAMFINNHNSTLYDCNYLGKCCPEDQTLVFDYLIITKFDPALEYEERFAFSLKKVDNTFSKSFQWNCPNGSFLEFDSRLDSLVVGGITHYDVYVKNLTDCALSSIYFSTSTGIVRMQLGGCVWDRFYKP